MIEHQTSRALAREVFHCDFREILGSCGLNFPLQFHLQCGPLMLRQAINQARA
jgi:hypothetical protein